MNARDIMSKGKLVALAPHSTAQHAAHLMASQNIGSLPVISDEKLVGMVTDRDLCCRVLGEGKNPQTEVGQVMSAPVACGHPDTSIEDLEKIMREHRVHRIPIVDDDGELNGFISTADLFRHLEGDAKQQLADVMESIYQPS